MISVPIRKFIPVYPAMDNSVLVYNLKTTLATDVVYMIRVSNFSLLWLIGVGVFRLTPLQSYRLGGQGKPIYGDR